MFSRNIRNFSQLNKFIAKNLEPKFTPTCQIPANIDDEIYKYKILNDTDTIPSIINGKIYYQGEFKETKSPFDNNYFSAKFHYTNENLLKDASYKHKSAKEYWNSMDIDKRLEIFLTAADKIENKYYNKLIASTILSQNKTPYEAEIDTICELADFLRFNVNYVTQIYKKQPISPEGYLNVSQYLPLNGYVAAITPFNFTAIAGNLATSALMMGNSVIWKPSDSAVLSNFLVWEILVESGMPPEICNFVPMEGYKFLNVIKRDSHLGAITFTGSSKVFENIYSTMGKNIQLYNNFPRLIGETGGKNFHFIDTVDIEDEDFVNHIIDRTFESAYNYSGQKCSACSRVYLPDYLWPVFKHKMEMKKNELYQKFSNQELNYGVINEQAFLKGQLTIQKILEDKKTKLIYGGSFNDNLQYFMEPCLVKCDNPDNSIFHDEYFLPLLSVYTYKPENKKETMEICKNNRNNYCLTGAIFSKNEEFIKETSEQFKYSAGNFYINDKSTGAVVGQQPFGGSGKSGTNDKAGDINALYRYMNQRNIKMKL